MAAGPGVEGARRLAGRLREYALLIRLDRPIGSLLLLWPTLWALWIAGQGRPRQDVFIVFVAGVFLMRSAGCAINDYADRHIDPHVRRTHARPVAAGRISPAEALAVAAALGLAAFLLVLTMNRLTVMLALVGGFLAASYPFLKRVTSLPQFYLGAAFGWAVPMAFAAQAGSVPSSAWLMFAAVVLWAAVYDTMYAMVDRDDDLRLGVRSTAILFGRYDRVVVGSLQAGVVVLLWQVGLRERLGEWYEAGLAGMTLTFLWQQWLIRDRAPASCFRAFLNNSLSGALVFAGVLLHYTFD